MTTATAPKHPARFTRSLLDTAHSLLPPAPARVLDPFAGVGTVHELGHIGYATVGVELEPEWAAAHERTLVGDATALPFPDATFDVVLTSPAYGNRMADRYAGDPKGSRRATYRIALGRALSEGSGAALQWGDAYRDLHRRAWVEARRVLRPGGRLILNISDHYRAGRRMFVADWHVATLLELGFTLAEARTVRTPRMRHGANHELRVDGELVAAFDLHRKPSVETTPTIAHARGRELVALPDGATGRLVGVTATTGMAKVLVEGRHRTLPARMLTPLEEPAS